MTNLPQKPNSPLTSNSLRATLTSDYVVIRHPVTGRFMGKYDAKRNLLEITDRRHVAIIDLQELGK